MGRPWHPLFEFVEPKETPFVEPRSRGELPHLYKPGGLYFVTFRLFDATTSHQEREAWRRANDRARSPAYLRHPGIAREIVEASDPPVELGSCWLGRPEVAQIVQDALLYHDVWEVMRREKQRLPAQEKGSQPLRLPAEVRYLLTSWSIMPNHVHVTYQTIEGHCPDEIHHSWKSYTAHAINRLLNRRGPLWERESFAHVIRSTEHHEAFIRYIEQNAPRAGLCPRPEDWPFSSAHPSHQFDPREF